jgi:Terminase large subunit, T4likevirus-type, N-terminal
MIMTAERELAHRLDPALWVRHELGIEPAAWQQEFLRAPRGASIIALTARQVGKTTTAAWAITHHMVFTPSGLSVIACPSQRQSAEAVRRVREFLIKVGAEFRTDNVYALELKNGSRVLALPGSDDSIRGLTVDGFIIADEAAQLSNDLIAALSPMRARRPEARFAMLSTAWSRTDPFWTVWAGDDPSWIRLKATAETVTFFSQEFLEQQRRLLGEHNFQREYNGIPGGGEASPFSWELFERATRVHVPVVRAGRAFGPALEDVSGWPGFKPLIIAHDVGRSRDRSTAVVGGNSPYGQRLLGISEAEELLTNQFGSARASALAAVDRRHHSNALIIADLSFDPTYAEVLFETFGPRVIGLQISGAGEGMTFERRPVKHGSMLVYTIGRSYLLELFHTELQSDLVRFSSGATLRRGYGQLANLEAEFREKRRVYSCPAGQHDDLGISCAMLAWAARHPHLESWLRNLQAALRPKRTREKFNWAAVT